MTLLHSSVGTLSEEGSLWERIRLLFVQVRNSSSATRCNILGTEDEGRALDHFVVRNWQWHPQVSASADDRIANPSRLELSSVWSSLARSRSGRFWPRFQRVSMHGRGLEHKTILLLVDERIVEGIRCDY